MISAWVRAARALGIAATALLLAIPTDTATAESQFIKSGVSANDYGGIGLLQTRTARFGADGGFETGTTFIDPYRRWYFRLTVLPWMEGVFRYTDIRNRLFSNVVEFSGSQTFKDRGADLKFLLWPESRYVPAVAIGIQDGLGTGQFQGEYLAFSKQFRDLDVSVGLGWGYMGNRGRWRNPLSYLSTIFEARSGDGFEGGAPSFGAYFSGERVAPFLGVEYRTPIEGLTLKAEYEGNNYRSEPLNILVEASSAFNYGLNYRPFNWLDISLAYERGNSYMSRIALLANTNDPGLPKFDPPPPPIRIRESKAQETSKTRLIGDKQVAADNLENRSQTIDELFIGLESMGLEVSQIEISHSEARLHVVTGLEKVPFGDAERIAGIIIGLIPAPVEYVKFIADDDQKRSPPIVVARNDIERNAIVDYLFDQIESDGIRFQGLDLTHDTATLTVEANSNSPLLDRHTEVRAAQAVLKSSPTPIERVAIVTSIDDFVIRRAIFERDEVVREAAINDLFDEINAEGFRIESLDIEHEKATVYLSAYELKQHNNYLEAAYKIAQGIPFELDEIKIVDLMRSTGPASVIIRRDGRDWSTVASGNEVADQTALLADSNLNRNEVKITNKLFEALGEEGIIAEGVRIEGRSAVIYVASVKFRQFARNIGRVARAAANTLPDAIEEFTIVNLTAGVEMNRVTIWRKDLEHIQLARGSVDEVWAHSEIHPPLGGSPVTMIKNPDRYPFFDWQFGPGLRQHIGGPSKLVLHQLWARLRATLELMPGLSISGSYAHNIYNNFDRIRQQSDSVIQKVRSDIKEYLQQGESALVKLQADYVFSPHTDLYGRLSAGLFEEMYGGINGEILYRPFNSRWAVGAEFSWVRQREFDVMLKFRNYSTGTGHFNIFYQWPHYNLLTSVHIGSYLARDRGGTIVTSREFDSGVRMGAWVTLTNLPFEDFGEGSFDKGIFVSIPLELFLMKSYIGHARFGFRPLTRDGGQMLHFTPRLYDLTANANLQRVVDDWNRFLD